MTSALLSVVRFHSPIGFPWTLNLFALLVAYWLSREIIYYQHRRPPNWLEWSGRWSYSIYLFHVPANAIFVMMATPNLGFAINWLMQMTFILSCCYIFYLGAELPSHFVARAIGRVLGSQRVPKPSEVPHLTEAASAEASEREILPA